MMIDSTTAGAKEPTSRRATSPWQATLRLGVLLCVVPLAGPHGGATAVLLRYHYMPGERLTYHFHLKETALRESVHEKRIGITPLSVIVDFDIVDSYRILSVSPSGVADTAYQVQSGIITTTVDGRSEVLAVLHKGARSPVRMVHLGADNRLLDPVESSASSLTLPSFGGYGLQEIGAMPSYPVAPGTHWRSTAKQHVALYFLDAATVPALGQIVAYNNTLVGYQDGRGQPVAALTSSSMIDFASNSVGSGTPVHARLTGITIISSTFNVTWQLLQSSAFHLDFLSTTTKPGTTAVLSRDRVAFDATVQLVSARA